MIVVHGHSMEPTYVTGDLVVLDTAATPEIGHIIVFKIPADEPGAGLLVVHRIIGIRDDGTFITQGDNAQNPDVFLTARSDILGSPRFAVPHGGQAIAILSSPIGLAAATGGLCMILLWPRKRDEETEDVEEESAPRWTQEPADVWSIFNETATVQHVDDPDVAAEAEAWLREQLELLSRSPV